MAGNTEDEKILSFIKSGPKNGSYFESDELNNFFSDVKLRKSAINTYNELIKDYDGSILEYKEDRLCLALYLTYNEEEGSSSDPERCWYKSMDAICTLYKNNSNNGKIISSYNKINKRPDGTRSSLLSESEINSIVNDPINKYHSKDIFSHELCYSMLLNYSPDPKTGVWKKAIKNLSNIYLKRKESDTREKNRKNELDGGIKLKKLRKSIKLSFKRNLLYFSELGSFKPTDSISEEEYMASLFLYYGPDDYSDLYKTIVTNNSDSYNTYNSLNNIKSLFEEYYNKKLLNCDYTAEEYKNSKDTKASLLIEELYSLKGLNSPKKVAGELLNNKYQISSFMEKAFGNKFPDGPGLNKLLEYKSGEAASKWKEEAKDIVEDDNTSNSEENPTPDADDNNENNSTDNASSEPKSTTTQESGIVVPEEENRSEIVENNTSEESKKEKSSLKSFINIDKYWNFRNNVTPRVVIEFKIRDEWKNIETLLGNNSNANSCFVSMSISDNGAKRIELELFDKNFVEIQGILAEAINSLQTKSFDESKGSEYKINMEGSEQGDWIGKISEGESSANLRVRYGYAETKQSTMTSNHKYSGFGKAINDDTSNIEYPRWRDFEHNYNIEAKNKGVNEGEVITDDNNFMHKFQQATVMSTYSEYFINGLSTTLTETGVKYKISGISMETFKLNGYKMVQRYTVLKGKPLSLLTSFQKNFSNMLDISWDKDVPPNINGTDIFFDYEQGKYVRVDENNVNDNIKKAMKPIDGMKAYISDLINLKACVSQDPTNTLSANVGNIDLSYAAIETTAKADLYSDSNEITLASNTPIGTLAIAMNTLIDPSNGYEKVQYSDVPNKGKRNALELAFISNAIKNISQVGTSFYSYCDVVGYSYPEEVTIQYKYFLTLMIAIMGIKIFPCNIEPSALSKKLKEKVSNNEVINKAISKINILTSLNEQFVFTWIYNREEENETMSSFPYDKIWGKDTVVKSSSNNVINPYEINGENIYTVDYNNYMSIEKYYIPGAKKYSNNSSDVPVYYFSTRYGYNRLNVDDTSDESKSINYYGETNIIDKNNVGELIASGFAGGNTSIFSSMAKEALSGGYRNIYNDLNSLNKYINDNVLSFLNISTNAYLSYDPLDGKGNFTERRDVYRIAEKEINGTTDGLSLKDAYDLGYNKVRQTFKIMSKMIDSDGELLLNDSHQVFGADGIYIWKRNFRNISGDFLNDLWKEETSPCKALFVNDKDKVVNVEFKFIKIVFSGGSDGKTFLIISDVNSSFYYYLGMNIKESQHNMLFETYTENNKTKNGVFKNRTVDFSCRMLNACAVACYNTENSKYRIDKLPLYVPDGTSGGIKLSEAGLIERQNNIEGLIEKINENISAVAYSIRNDLMRESESLVNNLKSRSEEIKNDDDKDLSGLEDHGDPLNYLIKKEIDNINNNIGTLVTEPAEYTLENGKEKFSWYNSEDKYLIDRLYIAVDKMQAVTEDLVNSISNEATSASGDVTEEVKFSNNSKLLDDVLTKINLKIEEINKFIDARMKQIEGWKGLNIGKEIEISLGNQYCRSDENTKKRSWKSLSSIFNEFCNKCPKYISAAELAASGISSDGDDGVQTGIVKTINENGEETNMKTMEDFPRYNLTWNIVKKFSGSNKTHVNFFWKMPKSPDLVRIYEWGAGNPSAHCIKSLSIASGNEYAMMHHSAFKNVGANNTTFMSQRYSGDGNSASTGSYQTSVDKPELVSDVTTGEYSGSVLRNMQNTICKGKITLLGDPSLKFYGEFQPYTYPIYVNILLPDRARNSKFIDSLQNRSSTFQYQMSGYYIITNITNQISASGFFTTLDVMRYPGSDYGHN